MRMLHMSLTDDQPALPPEGVLALDMRRSSIQRDILEALLLSECPYDIIESVFGIPQKAVTWYAELFFDVSVFRTRLDKIEYLETYPDAPGRNIRNNAVTLGYDYVLFKYANMVPKTEAQRALVERMFMATAYKAMAMNNFEMTSSVNKQAVEHAKLMLQAHNTLVKELDSGESTHNFTMLVKTYEDNKLVTPEALQGECI